MPDKYGFNHLVIWGKVKVACIDCELEGELWELTEDVRRQHFLNVHLKVQEEEKEDGSFYDNIRNLVKTCRICNEQFEQPRKRGRPRVFCRKCKPE